MVEAVLLYILWKQDAPFWFSALIGVDFMANVLQILPYRFGLPAHSRVIWVCGVLLAFPLQYLSLTEAVSGGISPRNSRHVQILAAWITGQLCCAWMQTQHDLLLRLNPVLLIWDSLCFLAWIALYLFW